MELLSDDIASGNGLVPDGPLKFPFGALPAAMAHGFTIHGVKWHIGLISNLIIYHCEHVIHHGVVSGA